MGGAVRHAGVCIYKIGFFTTPSDPGEQYIHTISVQYIPTYVSPILTLRSRILGFMLQSARINGTWTPWVWMQ